MRHGAGLAGASTGDDAYRTAQRSRSCSLLLIELVQRRGHPASVPRACDRELTTLPEPGKGLEVLRSVSCTSKCWALLQVVEEDGRSLVLGGPKQRAVLALLLMEANRPVSKDRLIDAIWGEHAPVSASETLDTYISRLRRLLGPDRLARRPAGYELRVDSGELDLRPLKLWCRRPSSYYPKTPPLRPRYSAKPWRCGRGDPIGDLRYEPSMPPA